MRRVRGPKLPHNAAIRTKIRITTFLDDDLLATLKTMASDSGGKYQTLLNQLLRSSLFGENNGILARIATLERAVFKKKRAA